MDFDYRLLAKYLTDMLSPDEMKQVEEWRKLSIDNEEVFSELMKLRVSWKFTQYNTPEHIEEALNGLNAKINSRRRFQILRSVMRYAAVILLFVSFSYVGWGYLKPDNCVTIRVEQGEDVKKIVLADGSAVWLKEGSSLRIPEVFAENNRKLSLQGEAFFDIAKNANSLFIVATDYVKRYMELLFINVNAGNKSVETVLVRGCISLHALNGKKILEMNPGERVAYSWDENTCFTDHVDVNVCAVWRFNQLVFENTTLREIANQLSIKYNVNVNIESSRLAQRRFRCVINEDERLPDVLEQLCYLAPITYRIESSEIYISEKQTKK